MNKSPSGAAHSADAKSGTMRKTAPNTAHNTAHQTMLAASTSTPTFAEALRVWLHIGLLSFGGPTAQIALMHRIIVDDKKWLSEAQYLNALSFCMLLPGPEAMQLATYAGWRLHGILGGLAAGLLFVLPGAFVVLALAMIYAAFGNVPLIDAIFLGIKAAVLVIVIEALLRIAKRAMKRTEHWLIAGLSFIAIFFLALPFPLIVLLAAIYGYARAPQTETNAGPDAGADASADSDNKNTCEAGAPGARITVTFDTTLRSIAIWLVIWLAPLLTLSFALGPDHIFSQIGWFFSRLAVVTFGGAYAVLAYMGQDVVTNFGWLEAGQMMDGLGLAETTPGPLILVTEFVGYLAAFNHNIINGGGGSSALIAGLGGALVALWATFAPCFLWIFAGAPYIEWINSQPKLKSALSAITAAVVGVILNLSLWFALHVFFAKVDHVRAGFLHLWLPEFATLDWRVVVLATISGVLLLGRHWSIGKVLAVASGLALVLKFAIG